MPSLPADTPRLPKWPFLVGDVILFCAAGIIVTHARNPFAGIPLLLTVACVALGAVLAAMPFITDYARKQDEAFDERQRALEALARTVATTAEQIGIAAAGLHGIAETATKNLQLAEQLPALLQDKLGEIKPRLGEILPAKSESRAQEAKRAAESEHLASTAEHIRLAAAELVRLETVAQKNLANARIELDVKAGEVLSQLDAKITALADLVEKLSAAVASFPSGTGAPARMPSHEESGAILSVFAEKSAAAEPAVSETTAEEPKMPRKRPLKKPKVETPEPSLALESEPASPVSPEPFAVHEPPASSGGGEFSQASPDEAAPVAALSADGATRLLVTAYIGIGNKLFLRGDGPGLSRDKGVPLHFVSIGKWSWETADATAPVRVKLYKNDEIECSALGTLTVEPGQQAEVTAAF